MQLEKKRLLKLIRLPQAVLVGIMSGLMICMILSHSLWLEMRINTALALPFCTLAGLWMGWIKEKQIHPWFFIFAQGAAVVVFIFSFGATLGAVKIIPAALIREGFYLNLPLAYINIVLIGLGAAGNTSFFICRRYLKKNV